ncbi:MAG: hypothetical protein M1833_003282 [Piccolia ochrophora]|nr:MAG: hypothetical protein M1833_003282 [Piccolia ochrophora]
MDDNTTSPSSKPNYGHIARPQGFLALNHEAMLSTRGQQLPRLIQSQSTASLRPVNQHRRPPSLRSELPDEEADGGLLGRRRSNSFDEGEHAEDLAERRLSIGAQVLMTPKMRSMRLIGNSNPRYQWEQYLKTDEQLKYFKKPIRKYYERVNWLIRQYLYIDRLLDSSLPHDLIQEYNQPIVDVPQTISEEASTPSAELDTSRDAIDKPAENGYSTKVKVKRTPRDIYNLPEENTPLLGGDGAADDSPIGGYENSSDGAATVIRVAININIVANALLLIAKIVALLLTNSLSVLASLVDAVLDFLSTAIIWATSKIMARQDQYAYPVGRRRLEPIGVLVFSVIMITSFCQVLLESFNRLTSGDHTVVELGLPAILIMAATVVVKFACWLWCRLIKNSSVQALAQDAMTDVVFNTFSIIFPLVGYYTSLWPLDPLGGALLSLYVIINWSRTAFSHIRNLSGFSSTPDERNVLLYLTMRFAKTIRKIQGLQAYHSGDGLTVECDVVLDANMPLRDSHDLGESLQYVLESVPYVERAFVHLDYQVWDYLPTHLAQDD